MASTPREIKVGAFVLAGLAAVGAVIFLIGEERQLFASKVEYEAVFKEVEGLKRGSPVRMGGVDVGTVTSVGYADDPKDPKLYVVLNIVEDESRRIRKDSRARIEGKGMLGDKMVSITVGSPDQPTLPPGSEIPTTEARGLSEAIGKLASISEKTEKVLGNLERTTEHLADKEIHKDLKQSMHSLSNILQSMDEGQGYAARILHDPKEADNLSRALSNFSQSSAELNRTLRGINRAVDRVNSGPGFAHEVIYGEGPNKTLEQFGNAADEVAITLKGIREGDGMAKGLLYGGDERTGELVSNLNEMSADLKHIVKDVRAGKGTVGALLVDPSVYEDMKMLLGNVERNETLRALVRYSIKQDEKSPSVEVTDPGPGPSGPAKPSDAVPVGKGKDQPK